MRRPPEELEPPAVRRPPEAPERREVRHPPEAPKRQEARCPLEAPKQPVVLRLLVAPHPPFRAPVPVESHIKVSVGTLVIWATIARRLAARAARRPMPQHTSVLVLKTGARIASRSLRS